MSIGTQVLYVTSCVLALAVALCSLALVFTDRDGWLVVDVIRTAGSVGWLIIAVEIERLRRLENQS